MDPRSWIPGRASWNLDPPGSSTLGTLGPGSALLDPRPMSSGSSVLDSRSWIYDSGPWIFGHGSSAWVLDPPSWIFGTGSSGLGPGYSFLDLDPLQLLGWLVAGCLAGFLLGSLAGWLDCWFGRSLGGWLFCTAAWVLAGWVAVRLACWLDC